MLQKRRPSSEIGLRDKGAYGRQGIGQADDERVGSEMIKKVSDDGSDGEERHSVREKHVVHEQEEVVPLFVGCLQDSPQCPQPRFPCEVIGEKLTQHKDSTRIADGCLFGIGLSAMLGEVSIRL